MANLSAASTSSVELQFHASVKPRNGARSCACKVASLASSSRGNSAITVPPGGLQTDVRLAVDDPAPRGLHSGMHLGTPGRIAAVRTDVPARTVPLRRACGRYVDWYRAG